MSKQGPRARGDGGVGAAALSPGLTIVDATITGFNAGNKSFKCKMLLSGAAYGAEFTVYAWSYSAASPTTAIGEQDLTTCFPRRSVGQRLRIYYGSHHTGVADVAGWWSMESYEASCT